MELMLALALSSFIGIVAAQLFGKMVDSYIYSRHMIEMGSQAQLALERIVYEIGESKTNEVAILPSNDDVTFVAHEASGNKNIHYYLQNSIIYRDILGDAMTAEILIDKVKTFNIAKGFDINGIQRDFYPILIECEDGKVHWKIETAAKCNN